MRRYILDEDGQPTLCDDLVQWAEWYRNEDRTVAFDQIGAVRISTIFLAINHAIGPGEPILYDTLVDGGPLDRRRDRYATREDALAGHARMVAMIRGVQAA